MNIANHSWDYTGPATAPAAPSAPAASTAGAHPAAPVILILRWLTTHQPRCNDSFCEGGGISDPHGDCVMVLG